MNKVLLDLGFIEIRWYSFFILLAILVMLVLIGSTRITTYAMGSIDGFTITLFLQIDLQIMNL